VLIVAYGNPLRSDDGLAWRVADALEAEFSSPQVEILRLHQLTPELAERVSRVGAVIFVDAASAEGGARLPGEIRIEEIHSEEAGSSVQTRFSHHLTPAVVIALAAQLYCARVRGFAATLTGQNFEHGESLSVAVDASLPELVAKIEVLTRQFLSQEAHPASSGEP
jgi:hydrogenase maturation protease